MKKIILFLSSLFVLAQVEGQDSKPAPGRQLFDKNTLGEIRLTFPIKNWGDALDSMRLYGDGLMKADVKVDGQSYAGVGVRYRGNNSYQMGVKRNPYQIKINFSDAEARHQGYANIKLSSALRDPSMVREMLFFEIASKYIPAPQTCYTNLFVNEEFVGVYIIVESVDGQFLKNHFGSDDNAFFKAGVDYKPEKLGNCRQNIYASLEYEEEQNCYKGNFEIESEMGWAELQEMTRVLNRDVKSVDKVLDVDRALWMLALNNVMVNLNSYSGNYSQNYYLYRDDNGRFQFIPWDLNLAFGSYKNIGSGSDLELKDLQRLDPLLHADNALKPLIFNLLKDPLYKKIYLSHVRQILAENFDNGWYEKRAQELQGMIVVPYSQDQNKYYSLTEFQTSLSTTIGKRSKIPGITELMAKRIRFLKNHPELTALPSEISDVLVKGREKFENQKVNAFHITAKADRFPKRALIYYRFAAGTPYNYMVMNEESGSGLAAGVKMFGAAIEAKSDSDTLDYFIVAENAGAVTFSPSNYTSKPYMVKLSDLNK